MGEPSHVQLRIQSQCQLLSISRTGWDCDPKGGSPLNLKLMQLIDEQFLATPYYGNPQMARWLRRQGRHRARRLMGLHADSSGTAYESVSPAASNLSVSVAESGDHTSESGVVHRHHLYSNQAGGLYLVAIMDWQSRKVLAWHVSNTMKTPFCVEALEEAMARYGVPDIFNMNQGAQLTS